MENKILIMVIGLAMFGSFLFGCASQGTQPETNKTNNTVMTCEEYCPTQPHVQCVGTWSISGSYPDCICNYTCETQARDNQSDVKPGAGGALPMAASVDASNFKFVPDSVEIAKGATVTWMNKDSAMHTIVADDGSFSSSYLTAGQTYSYTFTKAGTYIYHCGIHKTMAGTIIVK